MTILLKLHQHSPSKVISQLYSGDVFHHQNTNFLCQRTIKNEYVWLGYLTEQMEQIRQMVEALQSQTSSDKHRLIEIDEACKITRKAKPTIYTLARKGLIPAYKKGKKLYFYEDELLQWIESGRKQMQAMSLQEQAAEIVHGAKRKPKGGYNF